MITAQIDKFTVRPWVALFRISVILGLLSPPDGVTAAAAAAPPPVKDSANKLLVILVDGFRWNYFDKFGPNELPGFERIRQSGVAADAFIPVFPSLSFVNYYSIMTGLYAETHGIVDNYMWDERHNEEFLIGDNPEQYHSFWWDDGEPLWITAVRQGKRAYYWYWNGCEVQIRGYRPTFCSPYQSTPNPSFELFASGLQQAVEVLRNGSADLAGVYLERVDFNGHKYGPESDEIKTTIRAVDAELVRLLDLIGTDNSDINLVVLSDHGMAGHVGGPTDGVTGLINVLDYVNKTDWAHAYGSTQGPILQIWPQDNNTDWMYERLRTAHSHLTVYKKQDIPEIYHLKKHYRVPPLLLVADEGYAIVRNASTRSLGQIGFHGYDNRLTNMHGIFMATGPDFKQNATFKIGRLPNVNVYALMCHVMKLVPSPNNGTWSNVCDALKDDEACKRGPYDGQVHNSASRGPAAAVVEDSILPTKSLAVVVCIVIWSADWRLQ
jgi:ectonucleotide pyrophosphatase/phosphodiesterase family protein 6